MATVEFTETVRPGRRKPAAAAAPTPEPPPATPEPVPTAEQLEERRQNLHKSLFGSAAPKDEPEPVTPAAEPPADPATPEPPAEPVAAAPAAATPEPPVTPEPPAQPAAAPAPATSKADIETAARAAAKLVMDETPKPAPAAPAPVTQPKPTFDLSDEDKADYEVIQFLERTEPAKYAGKSQRFLDYTKAHYAYQEEWSKANPGAKFDLKADEHESWYSKNDPGIDQSDITYGREKRIEENVYLNKVKPEMDRMEGEKRQRQQQEAIHQAQPVIIENLHGRVLEMVKGVDEALAAHITGANGKPLLTEESIAKVDAADPIAKRVLDDVVKFQLEPMVMALEMTAVPEGGYRLNPKLNPVHAKISEYIDKAERLMLAAPPEVRIQNGKEFATISQFQRMQQAIRDSAATDAQKEQQIADLDARYYTLGVDEIETIVVEECAHTARTRIDFEDGLAKRKYGTSPSVGQPAPQPAAAGAVAATPAANGNKPRSPSISSAADTVHQRDRSVPGEKKFGEQMESILFK